MLAFHPHSQGTECDLDTAKGITPKKVVSFQREEWNNCKPRNETIYVFVIWLFIYRLLFFPYYLHNGIYDPTVQ